MKLLDTLEALYGPQVADWPTDPYLFLVWWHCGYPASDARCAKGWESLQSRIGLDPDRLLAANPSLLATALKPGGMVPKLRAMRLQEIALKMQEEFGGDLAAALRALSLAQARAALRKFPNIADPGTDRILLFAGISPVAAVPSNCRMFWCAFGAGGIVRIMPEPTAKRSKQLPRRYPLHSPPECAPICC